MYFPKKHGIFLTCLIKSKNTSNRLSHAEGVLNTGLFLNEHFTLGQFNELEQLASLKPV